MRLNEMQHRFRDIMLNEPDVLKTPPPGFAAIFQEGDIPLPERLKVYRNNIVGGLTDILVVTFPVLEKLVGKDFLEQMARGFILENPPSEGCMNMYGAGFDDFIRGYGPAKDLPYLPDVAAFEIALTESYYADNDSPLTAEALADINPDTLSDLPLSLRSSARLMASEYPLNDIRKYCLDENRHEEETLDLDAGPARLMVYRPGIEVLVVNLQPDEYKMLDMLRKGATLGGAVEATLETCEEFDFQAFLSRHLELETFSALEANTL